MPSYKSYISGFILSILLTLAAYFPVLKHVQTHHQAYSHSSLILFMLILAVVQLIVQSLLFLHVGKEGKPFWNSSIFLTTLSIVLIVVIASIWIMYHLNYNMTPQQQDQFIQSQESF